MHQFRFQRAHTRRRLTNRPAEDHVHGIDGGEEEDRAESDEDTGEMDRGGVG